MIPRSLPWALVLLGTLSCDPNDHPLQEQGAPSGSPAMAFLGASTVSGRPGEELVLAVEIRGDSLSEPILMVSGVLKYDASRLEFVREASNPDQGSISAAGPADRGSIKVGAIRVSGLDIASPRLVFRILRPGYQDALGLTIDQAAAGSPPKPVELPVVSPLLQEDSTLTRELSAPAAAPNPGSAPLPGAGIPTGTLYGDATLDGGVDWIDVLTIAGWSVGNGSVPLPGNLSELTSNVLPQNLPGLGGSGDSDPPGWDANCTRRIDLLDALTVAENLVGQAIPVVRSAVPLDAFDPINGTPRISVRCSAQMSLTFSAYLGGSQQDQVRDITTDAQGNIYITGGTSSPDFPTTTGDRSFNGTYDAYIAKLSPTGSLLWSTYLGGPNYDRAYAVEVDALGFIYVAGRAGAGFPVTPGAFQTTFQGSPDDPPYGPQDGFVCKLTPDGSRVIFCSYFGTSDPQIVRDLAIDGQGAMYLASSSSSGSFPSAWFASGAVSAPIGGLDGVVAKISPTGTQVLWATYIGGSQDEAGEPSIRVNARGEAYVLYTSGSPDAPTPNGFDHSLGGPRDAYLVKLSASGSSLLFGTYLGGSGGESVETHELALDPQDNPIVATGTSSTDFPTTTGAFQRSYGGSGGPTTGAGTNYGGDIFVARISADGARLLASTYLGGAEGEGAEGVGVDQSGNVYVAGSSYSSTLSFMTRGRQTHLAGDADFVAVKLAPDLSRIVYASYLGGSGQDYSRTAAVTPGGDFIVGGNVLSSDWPTLFPLQGVLGGGLDGSVAKFR